MPTIHDVYTFYLKADHIPEPATVKISKAEIKPVYNPNSGKDENQILVHFEGARRVLAASKTQANDLWEIAGSDDTSKWAGLRVTLTRAKARNGKMTIKITKAE